LAALVLGMAVAMLVLASLRPLAANRFHRDEAVYSSWGLDIASGRDVLISGSPVDKPPLFPYVQALSFLLFGPTEVAARLPSLAASAVSVALMYVLGRSLYGQAVGLLASVLWAASPYAILFAAAAFTDPLMIAWVLAACLAAVRGHAGRAGLCLGLAAITKQQGLFFLPLILALGWLADRAAPERRFRATPFVVAVLAVWGLALGWDLARARQPGFLVQSWISYGGLSLSLSSAGERLQGFLELLRYATGSSVLNTVLAAGLPLLLAADVRCLVVLRRNGSSPARSAAWGDIILSGFVALFLIFHAAAAFVVWDRYLAGLVPLLALLLARVLLLPRRYLPDSPPAAALNLAFVLAMLTFTLRPIRDAAAGRFPVGGDHGAYQGIEQVANYLKTIPADTTLYHRWLGWHWRFYLWGSPYDFRTWSSPEDLAVQAAARPGARRYVVFPSWRSSSEASLALADAGLAMREVQRAFRDDGSVSFILYRIEEAP
jgi:hypothetical protein